ncbi:MAG: hypothetical protein AUI04_10445 [Candidatus Rokubacteria bacterium 13_2_20CM_2_64_8]|nr:MAG: hypothetical protein AUI04_10445 [Candidatus Rokubacteria bacterium 13_2_20CM_2_64_8]
MLLAAFGGMALLLYGIRLSGEALQRATDARLRHLLTGLSRNRFMAVVSGVIVTGLLQSSSATTIMLIGFVSAGLMTFRQTLGVILGADIGTTLTVQLIAFKITDYALLLVGLGFTTMLVAGRRVLKDVGQAVLGLGLMFLGLKVILEGSSPLTSNPLASQLLSVLTDNTLLAVIVAAAFSAFTSSAATIGLALVLAQHGLLSLHGAVAIVLGANVGTCATALMAAIGASAEAKRVAVAHIAFKVLGVALVLPFIGPFTALVASTATRSARIPSRRAISTSARWTSRRSRWARPRGKRCAWPTWPRGCSATSPRSSAVTTRSCWRTSSSATISSTSSSARSSSSWPGSAVRRWDPSCRGARSA